MRFVHLAIALAPVLASIGSGLHTAGAWLVAHPTVDAGLALWLLLGLVNRLQSSPAGKPGLVGFLRRAIDVLGALPHADAQSWLGGVIDTFDLPMPVRALLKLGVGWWNPPFAPSSKIGDDAPALTAQASPSRRDGGSASLVALLIFVAAIFVGALWFLGHPTAAVVAFLSLCVVLAVLVAVRLSHERRAPAAHGGDGAASRAGGAIVVLALLTMAPAVHGQEAPPQSVPFGGCSARGNFCAGPAVALSLVSYGLRTKQFSAGFTPGIGYEIAFMADRWYRVGIELRASVQVGADGSAAFFSMPMSFARYIRIGPSWKTVNGSGEWGLVGGIGLDVAALVQSAASGR